MKKSRRYYEKKQNKLNSKRPQCRGEDNQIVKIEYARSLVSILDAIRYWFINNKYKRNIGLSSFIRQLVIKW